MFRTSPHRTFARRSGRRPQLEQLEDRIAPAVIFSENFDGVTAPSLPLGWGSFSQNGPNWTGQNTGFGSPAVSSPNFAFVAGPGAASVLGLDSPSITINGTESFLTFQVDYNLEKTFDGGQLLISVNGGAFQEFKSAGGVFSFGGYNGNTNASTGSPISGQAAWTGDSQGYTFVGGSLPSSITSGSTVRFRWLVATDASVSSLGMAIDDVQVTASQIDLAVSNSDGMTSVMLNQNVNYTIVVSNVGTEGASNASVGDFFPATLTGVSFTSVAIGGATGNTPFGSGNISDTVSLPVGSSIQ
jgi:uncharacterized repeat protein (TIGR01451 family)